MKKFRYLALILLIAGIGVLALGPATQPTAPTAMLPDRAESTKVAHILAQRPGENSQAALVLFTNPIGEFTPEQRADLEERARIIGGALIPNDTNTAALLPLRVEAQSLKDNSRAVEEIRTSARTNLPEPLRAEVTGPAAIEADLSGVFQGANFLLLAVTGLIVAVLLIATYRSPVLWLLPLVVIGLADRVAAVAYTWVLDSLGLVWNESTSGILSVLVFGAGTNYALLLISRYRDELMHTDDRFSAMSKAWTPTLRTVGASSATVIMGVACLLLSAVPTTRALGLASMVGIIIAVLFALFALPGVLAACGRWIFWPKVPRMGTRSNTHLWDRVGRFVAARPIAITCISLILLGLASIGATSIRTGLDERSQFVNTPESIAAASTLEDVFPGEDATPLIVATRNEEAVRNALNEPGFSARSAQPAGDYSILQVSGAKPAQLRASLRTTDALVGGTDAQLYDAETYAAADRGVIFPLILLLIFAVLAVLLRSLLAPLIMTISVLVTNIAALGLGWWVSSLIFGFERFDSSTPLYAFVFLVALGIDYSIFLITRTGEEARSYGTKIGVLRALSATGGVITSAGILLAAVFAALGVLPLVALAQVGVIIFIGVLLDTLVVRTIVIPALVQLFGEHFWWPHTSPTTTKHATAETDERTPSLASSAP